MSPVIRRLSKDKKIVIISLAKLWTFTVIILAFVLVCIDQIPTDQYEECAICDRTGYPTGSCSNDNITGEPYFLCKLVNGIPIEKIKFTEICTETCEKCGKYSVIQYHCFVTMTIRM